MSDRLLVSTALQAALKDSERSFAAANKDVAAAEKAVVSAKKLGDPMAIATAEQNVRRATQAIH